jgi:hypothetical protein
MTIFIQTDKPVYMQGETGMWTYAGQEGSFLHLWLFVVDIVITGNGFLHHQILKIVVHVVLDTCH